MAKKKRSFTPLDSKHLTGFTLVEVLVTILIVGIVSVGSYFAFSALSISAQRSRDQLQAVTLTQAALEEVRTIARDNFDNLEDQFSAGFVEIDPKYPGFEREIRITQEASPELKRADITVRWQERGRTRQNNLALVLSRPPEPLPANIYGRVYDIDDDSGVDDATVTIIYVADFGIKVVTTTNSNGEYTFLDPDGNPCLGTGDWSLFVTCFGYLDSGAILVNDLGSRENRRKDIPLKAVPETAYIKGKIVGSALEQYVSLFKDGEHINREYNSNSGFVFKIPFEDTEKQCFTIITGESDEFYPYRYNRHCGKVCSPHETNYNHMGWSSSVAWENSTVINCANPWRGSSAADRVCVKSGQNLDLGDIALAALPMATVKGYVYDSEGLPLKHALIDPRWHDWTKWNPYPETPIHTDNNGYYEVSVPAEQELFPNSEGYYLLMTAGKSIPKMRCCDIEGAGWMQADWYRVGPLRQGDIKTQNFTIDSSPAEKCGNAKGYVKNGKTDSSFSGVRVSIDTCEDHTETDGSGYYIFKCPPKKSEFCRVRTGDRQVYAKKSGFYEFRSTGNYWYSDRGLIQIKENETTSFENIRLWPMGYGTIKGRVVIAGTTTPISGATVKLDKYWDSDMSVTSDGQGRFKFSNVIETWPPPAVEGDDYYKQTQRRHSLNVSHTDDYEPADRSDISLRDEETNDVGDIGLVLKGQM